MRVLHISDFHYGMEKNKKLSEDNVAARENYMDQLHGKIEEIVRQEPVKYIFITGDIAYFAKKEEYDNASEWIKQLIKICDIPSSCVYICPGNHDVDRDELFDKEIPDNQKKSNELLKTEYFDKLSKRFAAYIHFCESLNVASYSLAGKQNYLVGVNSNEDMNVVCINTAWFAKNDDNKDKMWMGSNFFERIKREENLKKDLPTITLMHHPRESLHIEERSNYDNNINVFFQICKLSDIVWHGHTHETKNDHIYMDGAYVCGTGAVFENKNYHNNFHVYDINDLKGKNSLRTVYKYSSNEWDQKETEIVIHWKNNLLKEKIVCEENNDLVLKQLEEKISSVFMDSTVNEMYKDLNKVELLENIMIYFIKSEERDIDWDNIIAELKQSSGNRKVGLSIQGFEGTGKSTFLSLLYLKLKRLRISGEVIRYPVFIDLHYYDQYMLEEAKKDLSDKLNFLDSMIKEKHIQLFLIFDGCDDYFRKNNELEQILADYINKNEEKFILCIGNADEIEKIRSTYRSPLHKFINHKRLKLKSVPVNIFTNNIQIILTNLYEVYCIKPDIERIKKIINCFKEASLEYIDFRTLIMCVKISSDDIKTSDLTLSNILNKYLLQASGGTTELYNISRISTIYTITEDKISNKEFDLNGTEVIYKGKLIREYLIAYYFIHTVLKEYQDDDEDYGRLCNISFIFTPIINKFGKQLLREITLKEQLKIVKNLIKMYKSENTTLSIKSQICYFLGRIDKVRPKKEASNFLIGELEIWENKIYNSENFRKDDQISMYMVIYRSISVSLVIMGETRNTEEYITHLIYDDTLNNINRGFHLEYYSDKEYHLGESPNFFDDADTSVDSTLKYLSDGIKGKLNPNFTNKCSLYLDIITLYSIFINRMNNQEFYKKYVSVLEDIADRVLKPGIVLSAQVRSYVLMMKELIVHEKPYKFFLKEMNQLKRTPRDGWVKRKVGDPESIADHILGTVYLAQQILPDNIMEFKEYKGISNMKIYEKEYDKEKIIKMLLIHDMGEAYIGDHINKSEEEAKKENERFGYYAMLCTLPKLHGMNLNKEYWDEFFHQNTINAKIAHDIDKLEALIQAYHYKHFGENINLEEWINSVKNNIKTSLGEALLQFFIEEVIEE